MGHIRIQAGDFSVAEEWSALRERLDANTGAVAAFVGLVREVHGDGASSLELEHYPGMSEKSVAAIVAEAEGRWSLADVTVIHRVGRLRPTDQIVLVLTASAHRPDALAACEYIIDRLKTDAIFWKRETASGDTRWEEATEQDVERAKGWAGTAVGASEHT